MDFQQLLTCFFFTTLAVFTISYFNHLDLIEKNLEALNQEANICHFEDNSFGKCYPDQP